MKIAINTYYGCFRLSAEAEVMFYKRKYKNLYFYKNQYDLQNNLIGMKMVTESEYLEKANSCFDYNITYRYLGQFMPFEHEGFCEYFVNNGLYRGGGKRAEGDLIEGIKTFGEEKASGRFSKIKIIEIPNDVDYEIEEYDGNEWISEKHRTWR